MMDRQFDLTLLALRLIFRMIFLLGVSWTIGLAIQSNRYDWALGLFSYFLFMILYEIKDDVQEKRLEIKRLS